MADALLDDFKRNLNIKGADQDDDIDGILAAARAHIEHKVGPLSPGDEVTKTLRAGDGYVVLPRAAAATVATVDGVAWTGDAPSFGVLEGDFVEGRTYTVTFTAGYDRLPADLQQALFELGRHMWQARRGPTARPGTDQPTEPGYLLPRRVAELLAPYMLPGIA